MSTRAILSDLIAFNTVSHNSNLDLMHYISDRLNSKGIKSTLIPDESGKKANLYATIGDPQKRGVMLSGHTDVVPVEGQDWFKPAFKLTEENGKLYGRGTTDMKGFVASALNAALNAADMSLETPLHLAFSYDEEIGCIGVHSLIDMLADAPSKPAFCIVGEPTNMSVATGHKGKTAFRTVCSGVEGHSALAPFALNAVHLASDFISEIRNIQSSFRLEGIQDGDYDVPYTTISVGKIHGGVALNIVPNSCIIEFEIRHVFGDTPKQIVASLEDAANQVCQKILKEAVEISGDHSLTASIKIEEGFSYPGLGTAPNADVVQFVKSLTGANGTIKVAFGTEGGLFSEKLDIPTVVCGPGSMEQGHKPDEYITCDQLDKCDAMMLALLEKLKSGLSHS